MHELITMLKSIATEQWIIDHGGLYIVMFIIFAETGLFVGFFLPGDSLLFVSGMLISQSHSPFASPLADLVFWVLLMTASGVIGNVVGYWFGNKSGHLLMKRPDSFLFKKKYLLQAHDFYEKKGGMAIFLARFLPFVRTFAPIVAGMVDMEYKKFFMFNVLGCLTWVFSMLLAGFLLGSNEWVHKNIEMIVVGMIVVTTGPVLFKMIFGKRKEATGA